MAITHRGRSRTRGQPTEREARAPTGGEGAKGGGWGSRAKRTWAATKEQGRVRRASAEAQPPTKLGSLQDPLRPLSGDRSR